MRQAARRMFDSRGTSNEREFRTFHSKRVAKMTKRASHQHRPHAAQVLPRTGRERCRAGRQTKSPNSQFHATGIVAAGAWEPPLRRLFASALRVSNKRSLSGPVSLTTPSKYSLSYYFYKEKKICWILVVSPCSQKEIVDPIAASRV